MSDLPVDLVPDDPNGSRVFGHVGWHNRLHEFFNDGPYARVDDLEKNVKNFAATPAQRSVVGNGVSKPLSGYYGTLIDAQSDYPHATALTNELDWAVIQATVNSMTAGTIWFPAGTYICPGLNWKTQIFGVGAGYTATVLKTLGGDLINMTGTLVGFANVGFDATGGHIFNQVGNVSRGFLHTVRMHQRSADKCIWEANGRLYIDMLVLNWDTIINSANTVPGWNFVGSGGDVNRNTWQQGRHTHSGGAPVFKFDSTHSSRYYYDNVLRDINFELVNGGAVWYGGNLDPVVENCAMWDTTNATADFISYGPGTTGGLRSVGGTFRKVQRRSSTFAAGFYCWASRSDGGGNVCHFEGCNGTSGGAPFTVNLNNTTRNSAIRGTWDSFVNGTPLTMPREILARKTANQTFPDVTSTPVTDLSFAISANETWQFEVAIIYDATSANRIRFLIALPTGATVLWSGDGLAAGSTTVNGDINRWAMSVALGELTYGGARAPGTNRTQVGVTIRGVVVNGSNSGTLVIQARKGVNTDTATPADDSLIYANSYIRAKRIDA